VSATSRAKRNDIRRQKIAAQCAAARLAQIRRRILLAGGSIITIVAVVVTLVLVKAGSGPGTASASSEGPTGAALHGLVSDVSSVPASVLDAVGKGSLASDALTRVSGPVLTSGGKPELLYVGANFCPFCAAERWPMIIALSRFGTFSGLSTTHSSTTDEYPGTPTFTFYGSSYRSKYVSFVPVEETANYRQGNSASPSVPYVTLQTPTAAEQALLDKYDPGSDGNSIPFIDVGNKYVEISNLAPYGPQDLSGKTWSQVAAALRDPSTTIAQDADASANYLTAGVCELTGNQPATACTATVQALEPQLLSPAVTTP
jgi:thiol-disulfide isomerase/thioredoxin